MPHGIQLFDANGVEILNPSNRTFRVLGSVNTGKVSGSTTVAGAETGTLVVMISENNSFGFYPSITQSGNVVSWVFSETMDDRYKKGATLTFLVY